MLTEWQARLTNTGGSLELLLLSVDDDDEAVTRFRKARAGTPQSLRIADASQVSELLRGFGLDANAAIPVHVFVDGQDRLRCVRTGAISKSDFAAVQALLSQ